MSMNLKNNWISAFNACFVPILFLFLLVVYVYKGEGVVYLFSFAIDIRKC